MNIVFAHFGKEIPAHLSINIERAVNLFPDHSVYLIADQIHEKLKFKNVNVFHYEPGEDWKSIKRALQHPMDFRDGFWIKTLGRFLALDKFMEVNQTPLLHVESDVLLSKDFPFEEFSSIGKNIAFPLVSHTQGIASTLFLRDLSAAKILKSKALELCTKDSKATDMTILKSIAESSHSYTQILPTGPLSILNADIRNIPATISSQLLFSGYFDGLDFGYYLFGIDPRNNRGVLLLHRRLIDYFINPQLAHFSFNPEREFVDITIGPELGEKPIYSLHIHSKDVRVFKDQSQNSYFHRQIRDYSKKQNFRLIPLVMMKSIAEALLRRFHKLSNRNEN